MPRVFAWIAIGSGLLLCGTAALGLLADGDTLKVQHVVLAVLSLLWICFIHAGVLTYSTVTGKLIQQALSLGKLEMAPTMALVKGFKKRVIQLIGLSVLANVVTIATGAWILEKTAQGRWHLMVALPTVAINVWVFFTYYSLIRQNSRLLAETMEEYNTIRGDRPGIDPPA